MPYHFKQSNPRNEMSIINVAAGSTLTMKETDVTVFPETDTNVKLNVVNNKGTLNIDDSSIVLDSSQIDRYLTQLKMVENNGTINFKSGTISADIRNPSYGINNTSTGTVILGEAESPDSEDYGKETAHVSVTDPLISINTVIQYSSYGIYNNSGVIEFYDGKIAAYAAAMTPAAPNATEYMYEARAFTDENNNKYTILIWTPNQ